MLVQLGFNWTLGHSHRTDRTPDYLMNGVMKYWRKRCKNSVKIKQHFFFVKQKQKYMDILNDVRRLETWNTLPHWITIMAREQIHCDNFLGRKVIMSSEQIWILSDQKETGLIKY